MSYADLKRLSFMPMERTAVDRSSGAYRFRDTNGRIWTLQTKGMSEPGYDPQLDDASCGWCGRDLSPLDLPGEHAAGCKGGR